MSSHHFVKEFQEPAVYFHSLDTPSLARIGPLLEWAPFVLASFPCIPILAHARGKVDLTMVKMANEQEATEFLAFQGPVQVRHSATNTPNMMELQSALPSACKGLHIIDIQGLFSPEELPFWPPGFAWLYQKDWRYTFVKATGYCKWFIKETRIQINALGHFETENLLHLEENIYQVVQDGLLRVIPEEGSRLFLGEEY